MSSVFSWNESFLTGLPGIDDQHQRLVELINDLGELVISYVKMADFEAFSHARDRLMEYVSSHFSHEEKLMEQYQLDRQFFKVHCDEHRSFADEVAILAAFNAQECTSEHLDTLLDYLVNWLAYHILGMDHSMSRQIHAIVNGAAPADAFAAEANQHQAGTEPLLQALRGLFLVISERNRELRDINLTLEDRIRQRTDELEEANRRLRYLADNDDLTGLPNRRFAMSALEKMWQESQSKHLPLSILLLDADKFKFVNDAFGHAEGDMVLRHMARRIREAIRSSDVVCRLGGDEFLVLCPETDRIGAQLVAEKIDRSRQPYCSSDGTLCWEGKLSIGIATAEEGLEDCKALLIAADLALYEAKGLRIQ